MNRWSLRKVLISLIISIGAFTLPWQQMLVWLATPPALHEMSRDPVKREQQLRSAVARLNQLGNVVPYGHGSTYVELARLEADRGRHQSAAQLFRRGLQFEAQPVDVRLALVRSTALAGGDRELAAAYLHDLSRFAEPHEAGAILQTAKLLGLPQPWTEYVEPKVMLGKAVSILTLGDVPTRTVETITRKLERSMGATVVVHAEPQFKPITKNRLAYGRLQFEADDLAKNIAADYRAELDRNAFAARLIIVDFDIFAFGLNFVYATMTHDGSSIISLFRFQDENEGLVRDRATKQAMTSLLDQLGSGRPSHSACINANTVGQITFDAKSNVICSETLLALSRKQNAVTRTSRAAQP